MSQTEVTTTDRLAPAGTRPSHVRPVGIVALLCAVVMVAAAACSSGSSGPVVADESAGATEAPGEPGEVEDFVASADDFVNINDMTPVRGFFMSNPLGHLDEAIAVANDPEGGRFPVGTIVQLHPEEAMVKRAEGFDPASGDWEFFELEATESGTRILNRGGSDVENQFGTSCVECHGLAEERFDFICEKDRGCDALPIGDEVFQALQRDDPRPRGT